MTETNPLEGFEFKIKKATFKELKEVSAKYGRPIFKIAEEMLNDLTELDTLFEAFIYLLRKQALRAGIKVTTEQADDFVTLEYMEQSLMGSRDRDPDPLVTNALESLSSSNETETSST